MTNPKKSQSLHVENLNDELSVYDWQRQQMHSLNPTAASVFELCDGETSPEQMAVKLDAPKELIFQSLAELDKAKLLEVEEKKAFWQEDVSRRQFVKVGAGVAAAAIVSIMLPSPAAAQSVVAPAPIVLYDAGGTYNGNLGGRSGADAICAGSGNRPAGYANARAFISVSGTDEVRDMPGNYGVPTTVPIVGGDGTTQLAPNWVGLLDGNIGASLGAAGSGNGASFIWWTGSDPSGAVQGADMCAGWTDGTNTEDGQKANQISTNNSWISNSSTGCAHTYAIKCIAY